MLELSTEECACDENVVDVADKQSINITLTPEVQTMFKAPDIFTRFELYVRFLEKNSR